MYICNLCGKVVDALPTHEEKRPYGESNVYEIVYDDCPCGGCWLDAAMCRCCLNVFTKDDMAEDFCEECFSDIYTMDILCERKTLIEVPHFLAWYYGESLVEELKKGIDTRARMEYYRYGVSRVDRKEMDLIAEKYGTIVTLDDEESMYININKNINTLFKAMAISDDKKGSKP